MTKEAARQNVPQVFTAELEKDMRPEEAMKDQSLNTHSAKRSAEVPWPTGFSPDDADLFAYNEIFVKAPCSTLWRMEVS
jgi:hypothetical protein